MSARLLERMLRGFIKKGRLGITYANGRQVEFGEPTDG